MASPENRQLYRRTFVTYGACCDIAVRCNSSASQASGLNRISATRKNADGTSSTDNELAVDCSASRSHLAHRPTTNYSEALRGKLQHIVHEYVNHTMRGCRKVCQDTTK